MTGPVSGSRLVTTTKPMCGKRSGLHNHHQKQVARVQVYANSDEMAQAAASLILTTANDRISQSGVFNIVLSGGTTPEAVYRQLALPQNQVKTDWNRVHFFWGDERCVAPDHSQSNYRLAAMSLLGAITVPAENIHRIPGELGAHQAADQYEELLRRYFTTVNKKSLPVFDLVLLGLGEDGHTASLFPGSPATAEKTHWVAAVEHEVPPAPLIARVTVTLPVINAARRVVFLVSGENKAVILSLILADNASNARRLPASLVKPEPGEILWMVDQQAASRSNLVG